MNDASSRPSSGKSVLLIGGDLSNGGGVNRVIRDLSTIFSERLALQTTVLATNDKPPSYAFSPRVRIEYRPDAGSPEGFWRVMRELSKCNYDHVIGFWHWHNIRISLAFALSGKAAILTEHMSWHYVPFRTRLARAFTYRFARAVCVLNPIELDYYKMFLGNVFLLPNPVPKRIALPNCKREKLILAVGHLIDRKNFIDAVSAMAKSGLAANGWRLEIVGSGPEAESLKLSIRELGLSEAAHVKDPLEDIELVYARAAILLVTSRVEAFSLALAEAMLYGVVPVAYAADGPAFILEGHPDLLVIPGDVDDLAEKLRKLADFGILSARREAMKMVIESRFSEKVIAAQWRSLLG